MFDLKVVQLKAITFILGYINSDEELIYRLIIGNSFLCFVNLLLYCINTNFKLIVPQEPDQVIIKSVINILVLHSKLRVIQQLFDFLLH